MDDLSTALAQSRDRITELLRPKESGLMDVGMAALEAYGTGKPFSQIYKAGESENLNKASALYNMFRQERQFGLQERGLQRQNRLADLQEAKMVFDMTTTAADRGDKRAKAVQEAVYGITDNPNERMDILHRLYKDPDPVTPTNVHEKIAGLGIGLTGKPKNVQTVQTAEGVYALTPEGGLGTRFGSPATAAAPAPYEKTEQQGLGKFGAETYTGYLTKARTAQTFLDRLDGVSILLDQVRNQGAGGPMLNTISSYLQTFGIDPARVTPFLQNAGPGEASQALSNALIKESIGSLGSGVSEGDRKLVTTMFPQLGFTKEGNNLLTDALRRMSQRQLEIARFAQDYRTSGKSLVDLDLAIASEFAGKPIFDQTFISQARSVASTSRPPEVPPDVTQRTIGAKYWSPKLNRVVIWRGDGWDTE
ncbi:MAG: hypothetical protein C4523_02545 [Myxococcales bacterium]|nr:MAG: hypothetical protein C4523_02545 [Myxococcales bacterium]